MRKKGALAVSWPFRHGAVQGTTSGTLSANTPKPFDFEFCFEVLLTSGICFRQFPVHDRCMVSIDHMDLTKSDFENRSFPLVFEMSLVRGPLSSCMHTRREFGL